MTLRPGTLYGALSRLEGMGLIESLEGDGRRRPYRLTDPGATALDVQLSRAAPGRRRGAPKTCYRRDLMKRSSCHLGGSSRGPSSSRPRSSWRSGARSATAPSVPTSGWRRCCAGIPRRGARATAMSSASCCATRSPASATACASRSTSPARALVERARAFAPERLVASIMLTVGWLAFFPQGVIAAAFSFTDLRSWFLALYFEGRRALARDRRDDRGRPGADRPLAVGRAPARPRYGLSRRPVANSQTVQPTDSAAMTAVMPSDSQIEVSLVPRKP